MQEFRAAHHKMFGSKLTGHAESNSKPIPESSAGVPSPVAAANLTNQTHLDASSSNSKCGVPVGCDANSSSSFESFASLANSSASNGIVRNGMQSTNDTTTTSLTVTSVSKTIISPPPPLPPSLTSALNTFGSACNANSNPDGKIRKLNTFGKLVAVQTNDNQTNKLPANVLPKNNLNGLNQNETVKILRTSSPNKKKGPAPSPPVQCGAARSENAKANDKTAKIVRVNKKNEQITFLNGAGDPHSAAHQQNQINQIKLEGQRSGSVVESLNGSADNQTNYLSAKPDLSLSSLSIKVQAQ